MTIVNEAATTLAGPLDAPTADGGIRRFGGIAYRAPTEVRVADDHRLVLALHREAVSSESPLYGFLALWNALDAAFDLDAGALRSFLDSAPSRQPALFHGLQKPVKGWADYFEHENRHAVAHAVRKTREPSVAGERPRRHP
jgi:hypothetical protein